MLMMALVSQRHQRWRFSFDLRYRLRISVFDDSFFVGVNAGKYSDKYVLDVMVGL